MRTLLLTMAYSRSFWAKVGEHLTSKTSSCGECANAVMPHNRQNQKNSDDRFMSRTLAKVLIKPPQDDLSPLFVSLNPVFNDEREQLSRWRIRTRPRLRISVAPVIDQYVIRELTCRPDTFRESDGCKGRSSHRTHTENCRVKRHRVFSPTGLYFRGSKTLHAVRSQKHMRAVI